MKEHKIYCMDCQMHLIGCNNKECEKICNDWFQEYAKEIHASDDDGKPYCVHYYPEHWEQKGYKRNWGDAAVMNWPDLEVLRKEEVDNGKKKVTYIILSTNIRRPLEIYAIGDEKMSSWGSI